MSEVRLRNKIMEVNAHVYGPVGCVGIHGISVNKFVLKIAQKFLFKKI